MDNRIDSFNQIDLADDRGQTAVVVELCKKHLRKYPDDGFTWILYAMSQIDLARYAAAEKAIRRAIQVLPETALPHGYAQMGHLFKAKGEFVEAAVWYRKARKLKPHYAGYHIYLGSIAFQRGLHKQSEAHYRQALKCAKGSLDEAWFNLGGILLGRGNYAEAIKCYREALKIDPKYKIAKERLDDANLALLILES
jgi:tetratricopeptide (TPR) repeat protein